MNIQKSNKESRTKAGVGLGLINEIVPSELPQVNGYGFVATPSPMPGMCCFINYVN